MRPDIVQRLHDAIESIDTIEGFFTGVTIDGYLASKWHRRAVERELEILGEAFNHASRLDESLGDRIPSLRKSVDFRNRIAHGYQTVDDSIIWTIARENFPRLREQILAVLA